ncbi:MAG: NADH-quinone oxidoreductase subunit NuoE [Pseudomonadota bacterium]
MLRRLHHQQPESFAFTLANQQWAEAQIAKYPKGRQASAIIPLLWRAQEQEGWVTRPAIEHIAEMLGMAYIRALEVATFYFMFQLRPVGSVAHVQICGTTSCMICGAEALVDVCREMIAEKPGTPSADGKLSWEEVECLGACANAPMVQIGKDYYEDLTAERLRLLLADLSAGKVPVPGPQNGRHASEPRTGLTSLSEYAARRMQYNASVQLAVDAGDTIKRIDGTEISPAVPGNAGGVPPAAQDGRRPSATAADRKKPRILKAPRESGPGDLKAIKGIGPKLEKLLNELGFFHLDQIAQWSAEDVAWMDENLAGFKGRATRDAWVDQARLLVDGKGTESSRRAGR